MRSLICYLLLIISFNAFALPVSYVGKGEAFFGKTGKLYKCTQVLMKFEITQTKFHLLQGGYDCNPLIANYDEFELVIKDGKLFQDGINVGSITRSKIILKKYDEADDSHFELQLNLNGKKIGYKETWMDGSVLALEIKANLSTNNP